MPLHVTTSQAYSFGGDAHPRGEPTGMIGVRIHADENTVDEHPAATDLLMVIVDEREDGYFIQIEPGTSARLIEASDERVTLPVRGPTASGRENVRPPRPA